MNMNRRKFGQLAAGLMAGAAVAQGTDAAAAETAAGDFSSTTIDLGMFVSDAEKTVQFYTQAVGFKEVQGFQATAALVTDAGLSDGQPLAVRIVVLGDAPQATKLKIIQLPNYPAKKTDNSFLHSQYGFRYLTIMVKDMAKALERVKAAGVKLVAKSPVALGGQTALTVLRDPDGNFVELVGPLAK
jgi:catechol 2,3-dioxygenase-like lactoylglutathione lyase family enzyme